MRISSSSIACTSRVLLEYKIVYTMNLIYFIVIVLLLIPHTEAKTTKTVVTPRPKKLGFFFMIKSFFGTLIDPTSVDSVKHAPIDRSESSGKSKKGKGSKLGAFPAISGGASFGGVCGPNGCT